MALLVSLFHRFHPGSHHHVNASTSRSRIIFLIPSFSSNRRSSLSLFSSPLFNVLSFCDVARARVTRDLVMMTPRWKCSRRPYPSRSRTDPFAFGLNDPAGSRKYYPSSFLFVLPLPTYLWLLLLSAGLVPGQLVKRKSDLDQCTRQICIYVRVRTRRRRRLFFEFSTSVCL